ncbi:peptidyl-prolyl cis-trans isomerase FKBP16-1, chloroplastic isoform X2 [Cucumis sativus]|uniref:peptidyl-prolyl cis-trans isomerase FKBP16-1, chloroplastic isoform X2 n=1 Tax=Cucumis sativus TaxID=3659 RepID=UPI0012F487F2|nr:peptidyl-prolyl cis-trans isomerase FKBP16-1, chloroplastic isoform X2 [Cucumis sativus]
MELLSFSRSPSVLNFSGFHKTIGMDEDVSISKHPMVNHLDVRNASFSVKRFPRRLFSQFIGLYPILLYAYPSFSAPMMDMQEPDIVRTLKLDSGVRIQVFEGDGAEAHEGDMVEFNYVCRRSNGYFVHSTVDQFSGESTPVILPLKENQIIEGLKEVLVGMRVGGKRRALIPPSVGYINENLNPIPEESTTLAVNKIKYVWLQFGPRRSLLSHRNEPLIFEVQLLKVL